MALTSTQAVEKVSKLYARLAARRSEIESLNSYFRGDQPLVYASDEWRKFHKGRFGNFSDNWCGVVANSPAERLRVNGFRVGDTTDAMSDDERALMRAWDLNEMDAQSSQGFLQSIIAKRSAVIVWGDENDEPVVTWEHPGQVFVEYDPQNPRRRIAALKSWTEGDVELATLYMPDEVWKFQRKTPTAGAQEGATRTEYGGKVTRTATGLLVPAEAATAGKWEPRQPSTDDSWPIDNPLGLVNVVEFPNRPMLGGEPLSDIAGTVSMQNAINLLWAYLFGAADFASMPARVIMGQEPPKVPVLDSNGQKIGEKPVEPEKLKEGRLLWLTGDKTKIDQFAPSKLDVFTEVINIGVRHVAAQTRTPVHYIVGELSNVNGETLLAGETGLVKKVEEIQLFFGPAMREHFRLVALVRGQKDLAEACRTGRVLWADAETRTTAQAADAALKERQIGFPLRWIAEKRFGLTQVELDQLMTLVEDEANDPTMERVLRGLNGPADANA